MVRAVSNMLAPIFKRSAPVLRADSSRTSRATSGVVSVMQQFLQRGRNVLLADRAIRQVVALQENSDPASLRGFLLDEEFLEFEPSLAAHRQLFTLCSCHLGERDFHATASGLRRHARKHLTFLGHDTSKQSDVETELRSLRNHLRDEMLKSAIRIERSDHDALMAVACGVDVQIAVRDPAPSIG